MRILLATMLSVANLWSMTYNLRATCLSGTAAGERQIQVRGGIAVVPTTDTFARRATYFYFQKVSNYGEIVKPIYRFSYGEGGLVASCHQVQQLQFPQQQQPQQTPFNPQRRRQPQRPSPTCQSFTQKVSSFPLVKPLKQDLTSIKDVLEYIKKEITCPTELVVEDYIGVEMYFSRGFLNNARLSPELLE